MRLHLHVLDGLEKDADNTLSYFSDIKVQSVETASNRNSKAKFGCLETMNILHFKQGLLGILSLRIMKTFQFSSPSFRVLLIKNEHIMSFG